jgi:hypothetical protein
MKKYIVSEGARVDWFNTWVFPFEVIRGKVEGTVEFLESELLYEPQEGSAFYLFLADGRVTAIGIGDVHVLDK